MSDSSPEIAGLIAEASEINLAYRVTVSATALVFYDYALTLSTEVSEIWDSKFSGAQGVFFLTRYSFMVYTVSFCAGNLMQNPSETFCRVFFVLSWFILVILGLPSLAAVAVEVSLTVLGKSEVGSGVYGGTCDLIPLSITPRIQLASVILSLIIDVLVFTLTFAKTIRHTIEMRKVGLGNGLGYFILRDGAMYFLAKLLFGVVGTTVFFVPASNAIVTWIDVLVSIANPLTIILINRLVLNLRQVSHLQEGNAPTLDAIGTIQEPVFATNSVLGNIGAPLRMGPEVDYYDEEIEEIALNDEAEIVEEREIANHTEITEEPRNPSDV